MSEGLTKRRNSVLCGANERPTLSLASSCESSQKPERLLPLDSCHASCVVGLAARNPKLQSRPRPETSGWDGLETDLRLGTYAA